MIHIRCTCSKVLKVRPEFVARRLQCPGCGTVLRIRSATTSGSPPITSRQQSTAESNERTARSRRAATKSPAHADPFEDPFAAEEADDIIELQESDFELINDDNIFADEDDVGEDLDLYDEIPEFGQEETLAMPGTKKKKDLTPAEAEKEKEKRRKKERAKIAAAGEASFSPKMLYAVFGMAGVVVLCLVALVANYVMTASAEYQRQDAVPDTYGDWVHEAAALKSKYPNGFEITQGRAAGTTPWVKFEYPKHDVLISIRANMGGSLLSDIGNAGNGGGDAAEMEANQTDLLREIHEYQRQKMRAEYTTYEETPGKPIQTGFGEAMMCDFSGMKGIFSEYGIRVTVLGGQFQYNVLCKCPESRLEEYRPVFEEVIRSIGF